MMKRMIETILHENALVLAGIDKKETDELLNKIKEATRIFLYGEGRSGLIGKAFAMRLMHCGYNVYVIGETITPSIGKGDLLMGISASGTSPSLLHHFSKAEEVGAATFVVTASNEHGLLVGGTLVIPAATKRRRKDEPETVQPLGSQFDQSAHLLLDAIILALLEGRTENDELFKRHANIE
ncbi:6-phospho-3-hexuloisomerase [Rossellomorea sp. NPDC071047]|uniref:6-phospho-3-hexuloisomerase n=1 Tax=Rossellomorea sp. NPDC071047 TaxID=3390675 RepID=UPI003D082408